MNGYPATINVVCGPPEAGKTTYVREHMKTGDLVLDFDALAAVLCPNTLPRVKRSRTLVDVSRAAWKGAYSRLVRSDEPATIWIIKAIPASQHHSRILDEWISLNYNVHVIDPGAAIVFDRITADHRPAGVRLTAQRWYSLHITQALVDARQLARRAQLASFGLGSARPASARPAW